MSSENNNYKNILLYKTEKCRNWDERGYCRYGKRCRYAHGEMELRPIIRNNQYKTKTCKAYHELGTCPYGIRCTFIHNINDKTQTNLPSASSITNNIYNQWEPTFGLPLARNYGLHLYYGVPSFI